MVNAKLLLALYILVLPIFVVTVLFNLLAVFPGTGVFFSTTGGISDKFFTEITPANWTFFIWNLIYVWQLVWLVYALTFLCRRGPDGPLYLNPVLLTSVFFGIYILSLLLNIFWLFMFDRELMELAFVILAGISTTLWVCIALSYLSLYENRDALTEQGRRFEDTLVRIFIHNGIGLYAAWVTVATFANMAIVINYRSNPPVGQSTAAIISLSFIATVQVIYLALDVTIFDKYARYTFTPYFVFVWALAGILVKNFMANRASSIFTAVLLGVATISLIVKIVVAIVWSIRKPLLPSEAGQ